MTRKRLRTILAWLACCLSAYLLAACAGLMPAPTPTPVPAPAVNLNDLSAAPRISVDEAKAHFDAGSALFLDVRAEEAYARSHIEGSLHVPLEEVAERLNEIPREPLIITYCT